MHIKVFEDVCKAVAIATTLTIAGCASTAYQPPNQPAVAIGSQVQLNLSADVATDQNQIFIQNQRIVSEAQIDKDQIYCTVLMQRYQETEMPQLKVVPGKLSVWRVRLYNDFIYKPVIYANNDDQYYSPSYGIDFRTEIHLKSSDQPDISALTCTEHRLRYEHNNRYPERSHFETVLGDLVDLP